MNHPFETSENPIERLLDSIYWGLQDVPRGSVGADAWVSLISLMALKFLTDVRIPFSPALPGPNLSHLWTDLQSRIGLPDATSRIDVVAAAVEDALPPLKDVLQKTLLSGISRFPEHVLRDCLFSLSQFSPASILSNDLSAFGIWFDRQIDDSITRVSRAGESTTPPSIANLMVVLAEIPDGAQVLDPCCGVGTLLSKAAGRRTDLQLFGQEINRQSWAIAKLRLFLLDQNVDQIILGDSLTHPAFATGGQLQKFDCVLSDAPIGLTLPRQSVHDSMWYRFPFGYPGRGAMDNAFVQHAVESTKPGGTAIALVSHGLLFRAGADARVRESLLEGGYVESIIGLPPKLRAETAIETALVVFRSNRERKSILFIDASTMHPSVRGRTELSETVIQSLLALAKSHESHQNIARLVGMDEIRKNDFSLLPRRYVLSDEKNQEPIDLIKLRSQILEVEAEHHEAITEMDLLLDEYMDPPERVFRKMRLEED